MLSVDLLAEVAKLAGIRPKKPSRVSGTSAKLALKRRPRKAAKLHGKIQARSDSANLNWVHCTLGFGSSARPRHSTRNSSPKCSLLSSQ